VQGAAARGGRASGRVAARGEQPPCQRNVTLPPSTRSHVLSSVRNDIVYREAEPRRPGPLVFGKENLQGVQHRLHRHGDHRQQ